jgi:hypothetical protein
VDVNRSARYELVQVRLGRDLEAYVRGRWEDNAPWRTIAHDLRAITEVNVSHETLRSWFPELRSHKTRRAAVA